jgi:hypothetical protein
MTALVTGASRGLGRAISLKLSEEGARVALNYRTGEAEVRKVADEIAARGGSPIIIRADVSKKEEARAMVAQVIQQFGRLDILINNAGITRDKSMKKLTDDDWTEVINTNLNSVYYCTSAAMKVMCDQKLGRDHRLHQDCRHRAGEVQRHRQRARPGLHRDRDALQGRSCRAGADPRQDPDGPLRQAGGDRQGGRFPLRRGRLHHRPADQHQRRRVHVSADPFDPLAAARKMRGAGFDSWAKTTQQITSSGEYARAMNVLSQPGLLATALLRKALEKGMVQILARLNVPSRADVSAISQRLTRIEMVLDDLGAAVESLRAAPSQTPKAQPTVARPRGAA